MKLNKLEFKNIQGYGNVLQTIDFIDFSSGSLLLLLGKNGAGKSSISIALIFALYGKIEKKTLKDITNRINKCAYAKVTLTADGKEVVIERGAFPSLFKVWIDGIEYDQAGKTSVQDYLEEEIFKIPYHVFTNTLVLSIKDFKSFLSMTAGDKRKIIDKIFGFDIINTMKEKVKYRKDLFKIDLGKVTDLVLSTENTVKSITSKLTEIKEEFSQDDQQKINEYQKNIEVHIKTKESLQEQQIEIKNKESILKNAETKVNKQLGELSATIKVLNKDIELYEHNKSCPTCKRPFDKSLDSVIEKIKEEHNQVAKQFNTLREKSNQIRDKFRSINQKTTEIRNGIFSITNEISNCNNQIKILLSKTKQNEGHLIQLIDEHSESLKDLRAKKKDLEVEIAYHEVLEREIFSDKGIKRLAMKSILPILNANITDFCNIIDLDFIFQFDENFNCQITQWGNEVKPVTLSEGERTKADFIILISIIKLLKNRYPTFNLLFFDEIFSSVDGDGTYEIVKTLKKVIESINLNGIVISHTQLPLELFNKKIEVSKRSGFSFLEIEELR